MPVISRLLYRVTWQHMRGLRPGVERMSLETVEDVRKESMDLLKQFPRPKEILYKALKSALRHPDIRNTMNYISIASKEEHRVILKVKWPSPIEVQGCGVRKIDAERHAAAQVCKIYQDLGLLGSEARSWHKKARAASSPAAEEEEGRRRDEDMAAVEALQAFPNPKHLLSTVIQVATSTSSSSKYVQYQRCHQERHSKTCSLTLSWPQPLTFVARGLRWSEVEKKVAALACQKLKELGLLDLNNKPLTHAMYHRSSIKQLQQLHRQPYRFNVPEDLLDRMEDYFKQFPLDMESEVGSEMEVYSSQMEEADDWLDHSTFKDPITGHPYTPLTEEKANEISRSLEEKWRTSQVTPLQNLPADQHKAAILAAIDSNPVVVIAGETGCGKTTRIPRYILEHAILSGQGAHCNILITQPRRISAVSVSHRVGQELGPALCHNVGYQVRLEKQTPPRGGALLFCTVGVLLKKLQTNASMEGVSHVIVDEVHERDVSTDFLLILLKQMQELNPNVKVILMSATGDNHRISEYFGSCPIVRVPGFMYPVKQHYLEDVLKMMGLSLYKPPETNGECSPDLELISKVIHHIYKHGEPGSILCFLPGWQEIRKVQELLQEATFHEKERSLILPVHSNVPLASQQSIFHRPSPGVRKIVLATNIAETSVTIDDIVHVVDCGMHKELRYDVHTKVSSLETSLVSKSNVIQRRGRAGRCQPGFSYHLFTRQQHNEMTEFQVSEIMRIPLENLVLQAKIHSPEMTAVEFLSQALECPERLAIKDAVQLLQELRLLDENEELTLLGQRVAQLTTDPSLAKAIVLSAIYRCLEPMLVIVASLTKDPFLSGILNRNEVNKTKGKFSGEAHSDHLAFVRIFQAWKEALRRSSVPMDEFLQDNVLSGSSLRFIRGLVSQFSNNAHEASLVSNPKDCMDDGALCNQLSSQEELVKGVLLAGLYPKLIQVRRGQVTRGKFRPNSVLYKTKGGPVFLHKTTVNRDIHHFPSPWLTYFQAVKSNGAVFVRDSSMVNPLAVLLMTDSSVNCIDNGEKMVLSLSASDLLKVESDSRTIQLLGSLRQALRDMVKRHLRHQGTLLLLDEENQYTQLLAILAELLNRTADCFHNPSEAEL